MKMKHLTPLLALLLMLSFSGCAAKQEPIPPTGDTQTSQSVPAPDKQKPPVPAGSPRREERPAEELENLLPEVEAMAYLFDVQVILDSLTAELEQYSQLSAQEETFPRRSVEIMQQMQQAFAKIAALPAPDAYAQVTTLAGSAADRMDTVAGQVEEAFRLGLGTPEGAALLREANTGLNAAVAQLEQIGAIIARPVPEQLGLSAQNSPNPASQAEEGTQTEG